MTILKNKLTFGIGLSILVLMFAVSAVLASGELTLSSAYKTEDTFGISLYERFDIAAEDVSDALLEKIVTDNVIIVRDGVSEAPVSENNAETSEDGTVMATRRHDLKFTMPEGGMTVLDEVALIFNNASLVVTDANGEEQAFDMPLDLVYNAKARTFIENTVPFGIDFPADGFPIDANGFRTTNQFDISVLINPEGVDQDVSRVIALVFEGKTIDSLVSEVGMDTYEIRYIDSERTATNSFGMAMGSDVLGMSKILYELPKDEFESVQAARLEFGDLTLMVRYLDGALKPATFAVSTDVHPLAIDAE